MGGLWHSDKFDETADYIIIDDFDFDFFHGMRKSFWGAQECFTTTDKFRKGYVRWGKPCIWLCQPEKNPFTAYDKNNKKVMPHDEEAWYRGNCVEVHVSEPLYIESVAEPVRVLVEDSDSD